ncbi:MAG: hypothetical protein V7L09_22950 [Nostoc sp.]
MRMLARGMRSPTAGGYAIAPTQAPNAYCTMSSSILTTAADSMCNRRSLSRGNVDESKVSRHC